MKNKNSSSILNKLIVLIISSFILIVLVTSIGIQNILSNSQNTSSLVDTSNKIFIDIQGNDVDKVKKEYLTSLEVLYEVKVGICDFKGDIVTSGDTFDLDNEKIRTLASNININNGDKNKFIKIYKLSNENKLIVYKERNIKSLLIKQILIIVLPIIIILFIMYLIIINKVRYLNYICNGIKKISNGNLEYNLGINSNDELGILADEINKMSYSIKSMVETEKKSNKFKNDIITNISHDLRTPLTSLFGYLNLLKGQALGDEKNVLYVNRSLEKAERIDKLIGDLFEYSKLEGGEVKLELHFIDIIELLEQSIGEFTAQARIRDIDIIKKYTIPKCTVSVDVNSIIRVIENILSNAIKYSEEGSKITIDAREENNRVTLLFENISEKLIISNSNDLFERFYREDISRNQDIPGHGLGLSIARSIIKLHLGEIWIEIEGKVFKIYVRLLK